MLTQVAPESRRARSIRRQIQNQNQSQFYKVVHRLAARMEPRVASAFIRSVETLQRRMDLTAIASALGGGDLPDIEGAILVNRLGSILSGAGLQDVMLNTMTLTGRAGANVLSDVTGLAVQFNARDLNTVLAARTMTADLIVGVTEAAKETVRVIVTAGADAGLTYGDQARLIREVVGLPPNWARAPLNFERELRDGKVNYGRRLSAADKAQIRSRIAKGTVDDAFVAQMRERYTKSLVNRRALNIARTETLRAANEGQRQSWRQALKAKQIPETARRVWLVTPDDRLRETHAAVPEMNPEGVGLEDPFETPLGASMGPPLEPLCRCSEGLVFLEEAEAFGEAGDSGEEPAPLGALRGDEASRERKLLAVGGHDTHRSTQLLPDDVQQRLSKHFPASVSDADLANAMTSYGRNPAIYTREEMLHFFTTRTEVQWAGTSADSNPNAIAYQLAVKKEFVLGDAQMVGINPRHLVEAETLLNQPGVEKVLRGIARAQHAATQEFLTEKGLDSVLLARGFDGDSALLDLLVQGPQRMSVPLRPASSFSYDGHVSASFGNVIVVERVPAQRILGLNQTGLGTFSEAEAVVLGQTHEYIFLHRNAMRDWWAQQDGATWTVLSDKYGIWAQILGYLDDAF